MMIRCFIALEIPDFVLQEILNYRDSLLKEVEKYKWEKKEKLHVTLKFLGDTDSEKIDQIYLAIKEIAKKYTKFNLELDRFGFFRSNNIPRILWAGLKPNYELENIAKEIDILCSDFGFQKENRKFNPHITMLRIKPTYDLVNLKVFDNCKLPEIKFIGEKITIFESQLKPSGSVYNSLRSLII